MFARFSAVRIFHTALFVVSVSIATALPHPAFAVSTQIKAFYASCNNFSVDVDVNGVTNDNNQIDLFRYVITDAAGNRLFQEDASRSVGAYSGNIAINIPYQKPVQNPITFAVIDTDANRKETKTLRTMSYDASCLSPSGKATRSGGFGAPTSFKVFAVADSPLYDQPNGKPIDGATSPTGHGWIGIYRTPDSEWTAVYTGSPQVAWLPSRTLNDRVKLLPVRPSIIENNAQDITITPLDDVNIRVKPSESAESIARAASGEIFRVQGRSKDSQWVRIKYVNGTGWISARFACIMNGEVSNLPVVE